MPGYDPDEPCMPLSAVNWPPGGRPLIESEWRTSTVLALARDIVESGSNDILPILADALEDAGCDNQYVLNHCRRCAVHLSMCWVTSAVLQSPPESPQRPRLFSPGGIHSIPKVTLKQNTEAKANNFERYREVGFQLGCCLVPLLLGPAGLILGIWIFQVLLESRGLRERPADKPPIPVHQFRWSDYRSSPTFR
jgi:hypothetical protein